MQRQKEFDILVFIARGNPLHNGHIAVIEAGRKLAQHVVVLFGSNNASRGIRNPFYTEERLEMLRLVYDRNANVVGDVLDDFPYNDPAWLEQVHQRVGAVCMNRLHKNPTTAKIGLIGFSKDHTSYYLKLFPQWKSVNVRPVLDAKGAVLSATDLRQVLFDPYGLYGELDVRKYMPESVFEYLMDFKRREVLCEFRHRPVWDIVTGEFRFVDEYRKGPYGDKEPHVTVDAVCIQSGHILLVKRGCEPGKGLWALPGGFLEKEERVIEGIVRELDEESMIDLSKETLLSNLKQVEYFDAIHRSTRGRTITFAGLFDLRAEKKLPKVRGGDDCAVELGGDAMWAPFGFLDPRSIYEDHYHIMTRMRGFLKESRLGPK